MLSSGHLGTACVGWAGAGTRRCRSGCLAGGFGLLRDAARVAVGWWAVGWWAGAGSAGEWRMQKPRDKQQPRTAHLWVVQVNVPGQRLWQQRQQTGRCVSTEHMLGVHCQAAPVAPLPSQASSVCNPRTSTQLHALRHAWASGTSIHDSGCAATEASRSRQGLPSARGAQRVHGAALTPAKVIQPR